MFETLRKVMFFGLGAAVMSRDKIKVFIDDMVARGDVTAEEGRKLYDEFTSRIEEEGRSVNDRVKSQVQSIMREMGVADRTQIAMLESRLASLERRMDDLYGKVAAEEPQSTAVDVEISQPENMEIPENI